MIDNCACIKIAVDHNTLSLVKNYAATTNTIDAMKVDFDFRSPEWNSLTKTVVFTRKGITPKAVILESGQNCCYVPWEIFNSNELYYEIGIFGVGQNAERLPTNKLKLKIVQGCYCQGEAPLPPTTDAYTQIMELLNGMHNISIEDVQAEIIAYCTAENFVSVNDLSEEATNRENADAQLEDWIDAEFDRATTKENQILESLNNHTQDNNNPHNVTAQQIGALTEETDPTVPSWAKQSNKPTYNYSEIQGDIPAEDLEGYATEAYVDDSIAAIPTPDVSGQIQQHNIGNESHADIRLLIAGITNRLNNLADSDDETLNQLSEIVDYIKNNRELIDGLDVEGKIESHNGNNAAHEDIRNLITVITNRLNALADSDDTTLDQLSEVVSYIKNNHSLIESITTSKVNVADIINNLTTNSTDKPLSAAQGVILKGLIDSLFIPTKTSDLVNDSTFATEGYVDDAIAAIPTPDVGAQIEQHNLDGDAHQDIRDSVPTKFSELENDLDSTINVGDLSVLPHTYTAEEAQEMYEKAASIIAMDGGNNSRIICEATHSAIVGFSVQNFYDGNITVMQTISPNPFVYYTVTFYSSYIDNNVTIYQLSLNCVDGVYSATLCAVYDNSIKKSGGTMTGPLTLASDPMSNLEAATKQYVDATAVDSQYAFTIDENGHLIVESENSLIANGFSINAEGHLIRDIDGASVDLGLVRGSSGINGKSALCLKIMLSTITELTTDFSIASTVEQFNRTPDVDDVFLAVYIGADTEAGRTWLSICHVTSVSDGWVYSEVDEIIEITGPDGQSAYAAAQVGGYTDTQEAFYSDLAAMQGLASSLEALL